MNNSKYPQKVTPGKRPSGFDRFRNWQPPSAQHGGPFLVCPQKQPRDRTHPDFPPGH